MLNYLIHLAVIIGIYTILALSLQLVVGFTGLMNFGHIAFFGIGAYTSTLLTLSGVTWEFAFASAGAVAALCGWFLTYGVRKLRGEYLALATLGFHFVLLSVLLNWTSLTRGPLGIPGIPRPEVAGVSMQSNFLYLVLVIVLASASAWALARITNSRFGKVLAGVRDNEKYLASIGKNTFLVKTKSMACAAFFAGIAGSLFAHYINFIDPYSFGLQEIILVFTIIIVGGLASLRGTIKATFLIILIPEMLRFFSLPSSVLGPMRQMMYAAILLAILLVRPQGIEGKVELPPDA